MLRAEVGSHLDGSPPGLRTAGPSRRASGRRGRRVLLLDHSRKLAEKIRISGGGRCNFTNLFTDPSAFLSDNMHFCKSALS